MAGGAILAALIGAGATLGSGIAAKRASDRAIEYNQQADLLNFILRERERSETRAEAERVRREQQLGATDAYGNRTYFDPVRGWVTELDPRMEQLLGAQLTEQEQVLSQDLPMRRARMQANDARQNEEDLQADSLLREFQNVTKEDPSAIASQIVAARSGGVNEGYDRSLESIYRKGIRSGASNTGRVVEDVNRQRARDLDQINLEAALSAPDIAESRFSSQRNNRANLYNLFAERSGRMPDVSYQPQNVGGEGNALLGQFSNRATQGDASVVSAAGMRGGEHSFMEPDYTTANLIGSLGANLSSGVQNIAAARREMDSNQALLNYISMNGGINMNQGGSFAPYLKNTGAF